VKKLAPIIALLVFLCVAIPSLAAESTPATYKDQVEPICKKDTEANEKVLAGVRKEVKEGKLTPASKRVFAAARALKRARGELLKVEKPAEDATRLTKWLDGVKKEVELFESMGRKLAAGQKNAAVRLVIQLESNARKTNNLVLDYEFRYCRFNPAKFL
jgi:HD superfamily phosphodiesterase